MPALTSVIIIAADSGTTLEACVAQVLTSNAPFELIIADNASSDGAVQRLQQCYVADARIRIFRNAKNLGFGPACNLAAQQAHGDVLLFLNPDCFITPDTIAKLRGLLALQVDVGVIGVRICNTDGSPARAIRRRDPLLRRVLMTLTSLSRWESRWPTLQGIEMSPATTLRNTAAGATSDLATLESVEIVSGALLLLPRNVFEQLGGFDPGYFLHCEDMDLCRRARDAGYRVMYATQLRVMHQQGSSSQHRPVFVAWHKHHGMWRWFCKFDPVARNPLLRALAWLGIWAHFAILWPRLLWLTWQHRRHS